MFLKLNTDCIHDVLSFLPLEAILGLAPLSHSLNDVVGSVELWQHLIGIHAERSPVVEAAVDAILRWVAKPIEAADAVKDAPLPLARVAACIRDGAPPARVYREAFAAVAPFADARRSHTLVRIRPPNRRELEQGVALDAVCRTGPQEVVVRDDEGKEHAFVADAVMEAGGAGLAEQQRELWGHLGPVLVDRAVRQGIDQCVMAYGVTGSGKRTSVLGAELEGELAGLLLRTVAALLDEAAAVNAAAVDRATVDIECVEIYNERVRDLLQKEWNHSGLSVKDMGDGVVAVVGLSRRPVRCMPGFVDALNQSLENRPAAAKRTHVIYRVGFNLLKSSSQLAQRSTLTFVMFPGSEPMQMTGSTGMILAEARSHQRSMAVVGNIVNALNKRDRSLLKSPTSDLAFVPYRDSRLTHILKSCFGGNCCSYLLNHLASSEERSKDSLGTLRLSSRFGGICSRGLKRVPSTSLGNLKKKIEFQALGPSSASDGVAGESPAWCCEWLEHVEGVGTRIA